MRTKIMFVLYLLTIFAATPSTAHAQSDDCDPLAFAATLAGSIPTEPPPGGDADDVWSHLRMLASVIQRQDARCKGHFWTESGNKVLGPVDIPEGHYRATTEGAGKIVINLTATTPVTLPRN